MNTVIIAGVSSGLGRGMEPANCKPSCAAWGCLR
jgi:hypothetical protein